MVNQVLLDSMEWGYITCEKGWNIQRARLEFVKLIEKEKEKEKEKV